MKSKTLSGELTPTNPGVVTKSTPYQIYQAIQDNMLGRAIGDEREWDKGIILINATFGAYSDEIIETTITKESLNTIAAIDGFLKAEGVAELALHGTITFTLEDSITGEVNTVRITVKRGKVSYQQASYIWTEGFSASKF